MSAVSISVILANSPKPNPGMMSADYAFLAMAKRYGLDKKVSFFRVLDQLDIHKNRDARLQQEIKKRDAFPFSCGRLGENESVIENSSKVIYWGDFSHMRGFGALIARRYSDHYEVSLDRGVIPPKNS